MSATSRLTMLDREFVIHNEGKWKEPFTPYTDSFSSVNDAGIECEVGEFLYSMVRLLKPEHVLETGTHWGIGAAYMALGLHDNSKGKLDTLEFLPPIFEVAKARLERMALIKFVNMYLQDVATFEPPHQYKLILLDTEPQTRFAELIRFYDYLEPGGFVFIHDLHQHMHQIPNEEHGFAWPYGELPGLIRQLVTSGSLRPFHFSTPRGLTGLYKTHPQDYKWT